MQPKLSRLLIVEEALKDYTGHWYEYNKAVTQFNLFAGKEVIVAAHNKVDTKIIQELNAIPLFEYTNWDGIYYHTSAIKRYLGILQHNCYVYKTLDKFLANTGTFDCIFVPTVIIYHWLAWLFLAKKYQGKKFKRLVLFIRNNAGSYPNNFTKPVFKNRTIILKKILQRYRQLIDAGAVCIGTDSQRHAIEYNLLSGVDVKVFPHPRTKIPNQNKTNKNMGESITISCLGPPRLEKGIDLLQQAILHILKKQPELNVKFIVQWNREVEQVDGSKLEIASELKHSEKVLILTSNLTSQEYETYLAQSDCIILPYRRQSYYTRLSGIAVEATMAGIPLIYTQDTWLEDAVKEYGAGLGIENENVLDLTEKISLMVFNFAYYKAQAIARSTLAQDYHSPTRFLQCLWGHSREEVLV